MADNAECTVCGGTDFHNDGGFYYCNECQTQSQDLREQVYEMQEDTHGLRLKTKTIQKDNSISEQSNRNRLTSWEMYNFILAGLVKEFIVIGASEDFKDVVYNIWMLYLTKLEILSQKNEIPKLGPLYKKRDAEIVYNRSSARKKRVRSNSVSAMTVTNSGDIDSRSIGREIAKQKRALAKAEYEQYTNTQQSDYSLLNQTLTSLASDEESSECVGRIRFSKAAKRELLKRMTKEHLEEHEFDVDNKLTCHRINRLLVSNAFLQGPAMLTRNKLYSIIYIALLLTESKFQLSDIIRFCREGHLSYLQYKHFFPEIYSEKDIDETMYQNGYKALFTYGYIRKTAMDIYKFIGIKKCDYSPDLIDLCRRYCIELNLPDQIFNIASDLIDKTKPQFNTDKKMTLMPNFEGRVMAFIMFALKLLFSFDDTTEKEFTRFARQLNALRPRHADEVLLKDDIFVWQDWFNYIEYRKLILKHKHFPTKFMLDPDDSELGINFPNFLQLKKSEEEPCESQSLQMNIAKKRLKDLELFQDEIKEPCIEFQHTLTPFRSYIEHLQTFENVKLLGRPINAELLQDFSAFKIDYLLSPHPYLRFINGNKYELKVTNARSNQRFVKMASTNHKKAEIDELEKSWREAYYKDKCEVVTMDFLVEKILDKHIANEHSAEVHDISVKQTVSKVNDTNSKKKMQVDNKILDKHIANETSAEVNDPSVKQKVSKADDTNRRKHPGMSCVGRDKKGRFASLKSPNAKDLSEFEERERRRGPWFISRWRENPLLAEHKYNPSLLYQVLDETNVDRNIDRIVSNEKRKRHDSERMDHEHRSKQVKDDRYKVHYVPRLDYWVNVRDVSQMSCVQWERYVQTLPADFQWLLTECSRIVEQTSKDLFFEFVCVELYVSYVHLKNVPFIHEPYDNYRELTKLINKVKNIW